MTVRPSALAWLLTRFGVQSPATYSSKIYPPGESWTRRDAWWIEFPKTMLDGPEEMIHLVLQTLPGAAEFHYLRVPTAFLRAELPRLKLRSNDKVSLFLSAEQHNTFEDQRGRGQVRFGAFVQA